MDGRLCVCFHTQQIKIENGLAPSLPHSKETKSLKIFAESQFAIIILCECVCSIEILWMLWLLDFSPNGHKSDALLHFVSFTWTHSSTTTDQTIVIELAENVHCYPGGGMFEK